MRHVATTNVPYCSAAAAVVEAQQLQSIFRTSSTTQKHHSAAIFHHSTRLIDMLVHVGQAFGLVSPCFHRDNRSAFAFSARPGGIGHAWLSWNADTKRLSHLSALPAGHFKPPLHPHSPSQSAIMIAHGACESQVSWRQARAALSCRSKAF